MIKIDRPECPNPVALQTNYRHPENKEKLKSACNDKCMYCESKISHIYYGDIEHIKPKSRFPELEFIWENLGYPCSKCNGNKRDKFVDELPFLNPFEEDPDHSLIALGDFIFHRPGNARGEVTVKEMDLNRPELIERRHERIDMIRGLADKLNMTSNTHLKQLLLKELKTEVANDKPYTFVAKAAFNSLLG